jgi:histidyl-tRNA synthetase
LERIIDVAEELGLLGASATVSDVLVTLFEPDLTDAALTLTAELRRAGLRTETYMEEGRNLGRQFQYANRRGIPFAAVLGPTELQEHTVGVKDLASGEQLAVPRADVAGHVLEKLGRGQYRSSTTE